MIDVKKIFSNGFVDTELLETILNEMNDKINMLDNSSYVKIKHNEKIDLVNSFGFETEGDFSGNFFIKAELEPKKIESLYVFYEIYTLNGEVQVLKLPFSFLKGIKNNKIFVSPNFDKDSVINLYVTYEY